MSWNRYCRKNEILYISREVSVRLKHCVVQGPPPFPKSMGACEAPSACLSVYVSPSRASNFLRSLKKTDLFSRNTRGREGGEVLRIDKRGWKIIWIAWNGTQGVLIECRNVTTTPKDSCLATVLLHAIPNTLIRERGIPCKPPTPRLYPSN